MLIGLLCIFQALMPFSLHGSRYTLCNFTSLNKAIGINVLYTSQISYPTFLLIMYSWQYFLSVNILMSIIKLRQSLNSEKILLFLHTFSYIFKILLMLWLTYLLNFILVSISHIDRSHFSYMSYNLSKQNYLPNNT
jgi:hypothetical protein